MLEVFSTSAEVQPMSGPLLIPSRFFLVDVNEPSVRGMLPPTERAMIRKRITRKALCFEDPNSGESHWVPLSALVPSDHPRVFAVRGWFVKKAQFPLDVHLERAANH